MQVAPTVQLPNATARIEQTQLQWTAPFGYPCFPPKSITLQVRSCYLFVVIIDLIASQLNSLLEPGDLRGGSEPSESSPAIDAALPAVLSAGDSSSGISANGDFTLCLAGTAWGRCGRPVQISKLRAPVQYNTRWRRCALINEDTTISVHFT
jgi:hypothetical protein